MASIMCHVYSRYNNYLVITEDGLFYGNTEKIKWVIMMGIKGKNVATFT